MFLPSRKKILGEKAFTLIELMISCLIIGVLIGLAIPSFMTSRLRADEQKAVATLYAYSQAQKAYWFDQPSTANTYTPLIDELTSYVDLLAGSQNDNDWRYDTNGDADTFTVTATHLDPGGGEDGLSLVLHENGQLDRLGDWPY